MSRNRLTVLALAAVVALSACAPKAPEPKDLLAKVADNYKNADRYWLEAEMSAEQTAAGSRQEVQATLRLAGDSLGHMRVQMKAPNGEAMLVSNGIDLWVYQSDATQKQYAQLASASTDSLQRRMMLNQLVRAQFPALPISRYREVTQLGDSAKVEREEEITVGGKKIACYVLKANTPPQGLDVGSNPVPITLWIDKQRNVIWREERSASSNDPRTGARSVTERIHFTRVSLDEALPDSLFAFQPPPDAVPMQIPGQQ